MQWLVRVINRSMTERYEAMTSMEMSEVIVNKHGKKSVCFHTPTVSNCSDGFACRRLLMLENSRNKN